MESYESMEPRASGIQPELAERAALFGKWLMICFWMRFIPLVPAVMVVIAELNGRSSALGELLLYGASLFDVVILYMLGRKEQRFRSCAGLTMVTFCAGIVLKVVGSEALSDLWSVPSTIINLCAQYQFMHGCREILLGIDNDQARKWHTLWLWDIGLLAGMIVGMLPLMIVVMIFESEIVAMGALIVLFGLLIALLVVAVLELVYLYRTAGLFRRISRAAEQLR